MLTPAGRIDPPAWMTCPQTHLIFQALRGEHDSGSPDVLFVGGCVRSAILREKDPVLKGDDPPDLDLATTHTPQAVIAILGSVPDVRVFPTGLSHGTVTARIGTKSFEITTLRRDVRTDGRHADVVFTRAWEDDALRRDFTLNTLLADENGTLYDPTGEGLTDLMAGRVVFVGNPDSRIREDRLRILRFFRFHAWYGRGAPDCGALAACRDQADTLEHLSRERVTQEWRKILACPSPAPILGMMAEAGVLQNILKGAGAQDPGWQESVAWLARAQDRYARPTASLFWPRLLLLMREGVCAEPSTILTLSRAENRHLERLSQGLARLAQTPPDEAPDIKPLIYRLGNDFPDTLLLWAARHDKREHTPFGLWLARALETAQAWPVPVFPLTGADLLREGTPQSPRIGEILARTEDWWITHDFTPDSSACLAHAKTVAKRP